MVEQAMMYSAVLFVLDLNRDLVSSRVVILCTGYAVHN